MERLVCETSLCTILRIYVVHQHGCWRLYLCRTTIKWHWVFVSWYRLVLLVVNPQPWRIGQQGKRTRDRARTQDLRSSAEFQPLEPPIPLKILCPHASRCWACYHHTAHSTSLEARVLSGRWIAPHQWPVLKGNWGRRILTGIGGSSGWNSAIERRSRIRVRSLVLFPLSLYSPELWIYNYQNK